MNRIARDDYLSTLKNLKDHQIIKVVTGVRRCGKSTLLEIYRDSLRQSGVGDDQMIAINFEDPTYEELTDWRKLYDYVRSKQTEGKMTYVFLDEVQIVDQFEKAADGLFIDKNIDLYITGSNAYMLSGELATLLSGRYVEIKMLPLSFKEYVSAFGLSRDRNLLYRQYIQNSSFPQAVSLAEDAPGSIAMFLDGIYNTIILKDVMRRSGINNKETLSRVVKYLYDNIGNQTSVNGISRSLNDNASYGTVLNYVQALIDSFLIYKADRYDIKGKEYLKTQEKYYAVDMGLRYNILGQAAGRDTGHILENIIYLELLRRGYSVFVGKYDDKEVDFVARDARGFEYYQVALTVRDEAVMAREITPLQKISDSYPKYILTLDEDPVADYEGIRKLNAIDWLLA